jgi:hypothetical protein
MQNFEKSNALEDTGWACVHCGQFNTRTQVCVKCGSRFEFIKETTKQIDKEIIQPPSLIEIARILILISSTPNIHHHPLPGDIQGDFDHWFDGGAIRIETGFSTYKFNDGIIATDLDRPFFGLTIEFPNGAHVSIVK